MVATPHSLEQKHAICKRVSKSYLEFLWDRHIISDLQFIAGMAYGVLRARAFRSLAIPTRLSAMGHLTEKIRGKNYDAFEDFHTEKAWAYFMKSLDPEYHNGFRVAKFLDHLTQDYQLDTLRDTDTLPSYEAALNIAANIWIALEKSKLQTLIPKQIGHLFCPTRNLIH